MLSIHCARRLTEQRGMDGLHCTDGHPWMQESGSGPARLIAEQFTIAVAGFNSGGGSWYWWQSPCSEQFQNVGQADRVEIYGVRSR